jgi:hypothetical protein
MVIKIDHKGLKRLDKSPEYRMPPKVPLDHFEFKDIRPIEPIVTEPQDNLES